MISAFLSVAADCAAIAASLERPLDVRVEPIGYGELSIATPTIDRPGFAPRVPVGPFVYADTAPAYDPATGGSRF